MHRTGRVNLWVMRTCKEEYSEPWQTSKMGLFVKIVYSFKLLTVFPESSILDVREGFEYMLLCIWSVDLESSKMVQKTYSSPLKISAVTLCTFPSESFVFFVSETTCFTRLS